MPKRLKANFDDNNYTILLQSVIQGRAVGGGDEELDDEELGVWAYLLNQSETYDVGVSEIADRFGWSRNKANQVVKRLEGKSFLFRDKRNYHPRTGAAFIVADHPGLLVDWLKSENLYESWQKKHGKVQSDDEKYPSSNEQSEQPTEEKREKRPTIPPSLTERLATVFLITPWKTADVDPTAFGRNPLFANPPLESDRKPIRHTLPYHWRRKVAEVTSPSPLPTNSTRSAVSSIDYSGAGFFLAVSSMHYTAVSSIDYTDRPAVSSIDYTHPQRIRLLQTIRLQTNVAAPIKHIQRYSNVSQQRAGAGASLDSNYIASNKRGAPNIDRSHRRWMDVFGSRGSYFYQGVVAYVKGRSNGKSTESAPEGAADEHRPGDKTQLQPKTLDEDLKDSDSIKRAYRAIWIDPFENEDERPTTPTDEDRHRADQFGIDARRVMLLRQVAELVLDPHVFDTENTYDSPGRDPWALRMYCDLAFPNTKLNRSQKEAIDKKVSQALPASPAEWAKVLLHGLERDWSPRYPENFWRAYRHRMDIERDPSREPMLGGRRMSRTNVIYGKGIDLTEEDLDRVAPAQMNENGTHPGREMSPIHGPGFDARDLSERVEVRGSPFDENGRLAKNSEPGSGGGK